jgi:FkbH-like protein
MTRPPSPSTHAVPSSHDVHADRSDSVAAGNRLRKADDVEGAAAMYLDAARRAEIPPASLCVKLARCYHDLGQPQEALRWATAVVDSGDDLAAWHAAASLVERLHEDARRSARRTARVAVIGSYTLTQFASLLRLPALRAGLALDIHEGAFGQYRQEVLDAGSALWAFEPDFVIIAVHERDLALPFESDTPLETVDAEVEQWTSLWAQVASRSRARVVQHTFVVPPDPPLGHLASRRMGSRYAMTQALNLRLGDAAGADVLFVDCNRLAAIYGTTRWFDARYWHHAKQAVALGALPLLTRHTAAVLAGDLGLARKALVLDLDGTLWGGIIGEDGPAGIRLGGNAEGEAYVAFQEQILALQRKGVVLAVCSKNNAAEAREPFERHPEMRIRLHDVAAFVAGWDSKVEGLRAVADQLNLGLESLVFVDDNPAERQLVRLLLPAVDVLPLPADPADYSRALSDYLLFETSALTAEDSQRAAQYRARAEAKALESAATSMDAFYRSLQMRAEITQFREVDGPRIAQLVAKTNQFNVTTRRHSAQQLAEFARDPRCIHLAVRLRDRFADHGLVGVLIAFVDGPVAAIDTWLMSCRVIGRTVEDEMFERLCRAALARGATAIEGTYIPTPRNGLVADLFARMGLDWIGDGLEGQSRWRLDLGSPRRERELFIDVSDAPEERA